MLRKLIHLQFWFSSSLLSVPILASLLAFLICTTTGIARIAHLTPFYAGLIGVETIAWAIAMLHFRLNRLTLQRDSIQLIKAGIISQLLVFSLLFFYRGMSFSRTFVALAGVINFFLAGIALWLVKNYSQWSPIFFKHPSVGIIGSGAHAHEIAGRLSVLSVIRPEITFFTRIPGEVSLNHTGIPVIDMDELTQAIGERRASELLVAVGPEHYSLLPEILKSTRPLPIPTRISVDFGQSVYVPNHMVKIGDVPIFTVEPMPLDSLEYSVVKRAFDFGFSSLILLISAPLMLFIAMMIKLSSRGPVLFRQERVGFSGKRFDMLKFRTMRVVEEAVSDTVWAAERDPRKTWVGSILRRTSLDELPQFLNVLRGEMSVVGPRPERPYFVQQFEQEIGSYNRRHIGHVGITGWAQVNGLRGDTCIRTRVEYDLFYLQNWSLTFDLRIIFLTVFRGFVSRNAY